jgi:hypothetical protein
MNIRFDEMPPTVDPMILEYHELAFVITMMVMIQMVILTMMIMVARRVISIQVQV